MSFILGCCSRCCGLQAWSSCCLFFIVPEMGSTGSRCWWMLFWRLSFLWTHVTLFAVISYQGTCSDLIAFPKPHLHHTGLKIQTQNFISFYYLFLCHDFYVFEIKISLNILWHTVCSLLPPDVKLWSSNSCYRILKYFLNISAIQSLPLHILFYEFLEVISF